MRKEEFKKELKKLHVEGVTVEEIANTVHASRQRVNGWLTGKGAPLYAEKVIGVLQDAVRRKYQSRNSK